MTIGQVLKRTGGLASVAGTGLLVLSLFASPASAAGNPNFDGILHADQPTGFLVSPTAYDLSKGPVTVNFNVPVTNKTKTGKSVALNFSAHHIMTATINNQVVNVADGQPGQPGIAFDGPQGTTQTLMSGTQAFTLTIAGSAHQTLALTYVLDTCGYFQMDVWAHESNPELRDRETLASGFIRILGCVDGPTPTPTPTSTPTPTGSVQGTTASPTPRGSVAAITTPSTGANTGDPATTGGLLLLTIGAGLLLTGARHKRAEIRG